MDIEGMRTGFGEARFKILSPKAKLAWYAEKSAIELSEKELKEAFAYAYIYAYKDAPEELGEEPTAESILENYAMIRSEIFELIKEKCRHRILAAYYITSGIRQQLGADVVLDAVNLQKQVQGEFKAEELLAHIDFNCHARTKHFLTQWVNEKVALIEGKSEEEAKDIHQELRRFVFTLSGSDTLGSQNLTIVDALRGDGEAVSLPEFHTCYLRGDFPIYPNYATFKKKLNQSIEYALAGEGYQMD
jgi:hypothetical protein